MANTLFADSYDTYATASLYAADQGLASRWTVTGFSTTRHQISTTGRFPGSRSYRNTGGAGPYIEGLFSAATSTLTINLAFYHTDEHATFSFMGIRTAIGGTTQVSFRMNADGSMSIYRAGWPNGGTLLGTTASGIFSYGQWYNLMIEVVIDAATGRVTLYVDDINTPVINLTGVNTAQSGTTAQTIILGSSLNLTWNFYVDDLWIGDSATRPADFLRSETIYPDSDGSPLDLVPSTGAVHYAMVDDAPCVVTDYLQGSLVGEYDSLGLGNLATTPQFIQAAQPYLHVGKTDVAARSVNVEIKSGATVSTGSAFAIGDGNRFQRPLDVDPDTSAAWTEAAINALLIQPKIAV